MEQKVVMSRAVVWQWWSQEAAAAPAWDALVAWGAQVLGQTTGPRGGDETGVEGAGAGGDVGDPQVVAAVAIAQGVWCCAGLPVWQVAGELTESQVAGLTTALLQHMAVRCTRGSRLTQVYRQLDERGRFAGDVLRDLDADPVAGMVLACAVPLDGSDVAGPGPWSPPAWRRSQSSAMPVDVARYPVRDERSAVSD